MTEPMSNGALSPNNVTDNIDEDDQMNPSPPPSETVDKVEEILDRVESYNSVIPDTVTKSILESSGLNNPDPAVTRLISIAAQKFISDISYEALQHCKMRGGGKDQKSKGSGKDRKYGMTTEDIVVALADQGIAIKKPPYHTN